MALYCLWSADGARQGKQWHTVVVFSWLGWRAVEQPLHISSAIYTHDMKMPRQTGILSVGEPGASERAGSMGAAEPWEAMGMEEGEAHKEMVSQSAVTCDHEELKTELVSFALLWFLDQNNSFRHCRICALSTHSCCNSSCRESRDLGI
jgi:hypothetical protein